MAALMAAKASVATLADRERLFWWRGFLTAGMGAAVASLGEPAGRALPGGEPREAIVSVVVDDLTPKELRLICAAQERLRGVLPTYGFFHTEPVRNPSGQLTAFRAYDRGDETRRLLAEVAVRAGGEFAPTRLQPWHSPGAPKNTHLVSADSSAFGCSEV
jgi:hypothetical protein